jgi:ankyrin repeat protein
MKDLMPILKMILADTALTVATLNGHVDTARELLKHNKVNVNHQRKTGNTALSLASFQNRRIRRLLLSC